MAYFISFLFLNNGLFYEICMLLMQITQMLTCYPVSVHLPDDIAVNEVVLEFLLCHVAVVNYQKCLTFSICSPFKNSNLYLPCWSIAYFLLWLKGRLFRGRCLFCASAYMLKLFSNLFIWEQFAQAMFEGCQRFIFPVAFSSV